MERGGYEYTIAISAEILGLGIHKIKRRFFKEIPVAKGMKPWPAGRKSRKPSKRRKAR